MFTNCKNTKDQGTVGVAAAIHWFVKSGYIVSVPLNDCQRYDLVVEKKGILHRVEVKTTKYKNRSGNYEVLISTQGGNQSYNTKTKFNKEDADILFVLTDEGRTYLFYTDHITAKNSITLNSERAVNEVF